MLKSDKSKALFERAKRYLVGGVNSPVRAFKFVGGNPIFISHAKGSKIYSVDGQEFVDYVSSWGAIILGHAYPDIVDEIKRVCEGGTSFGSPTEYEIELAELICDAIPSVEMCRFVNSGTEATMSALRLARAYTNRKKIVKFQGCYHGHYDALLVEAGSGVITLGIPGSAGVPEEMTSNTLVLPFNSEEAVREAFKQYGEDIAAVIVEPVPANMGVVLPKEGFLKFLRDITREYGSLLIFDEVITGFRVTYGGAQNLFDVHPDITCLGKIIGGGLPVGAYCGRKDIMELVAPEGPVYQAGTLSGNPLAMAVGAKTLKILKENPQIYDHLERVSATLEEGIKDIIYKKGPPITANRFSSMLTVFFTDGEIRDYTDVKRCRKEDFSRFFWNMLNNGIYLPPSQFEAWFLTYSHTYDDIEKTLYAVEKSL